MCTNPPCSRCPSAASASSRPVSEADTTSSASNMPASTPSGAGFFGIGLPFGSMPSSVTSVSRSTFATVTVATCRSVTTCSRSGATAGSRSTVSTCSGGSAHASLKRLRRCVASVSRKSGPYQSRHACRPTALDGRPMGSMAAMASACSSSRRPLRLSQVERTAAVSCLAVGARPRPPVRCATRAMMGAFAASVSACSATRPATTPGKPAAPNAPVSASSSRPSTVWPPTRSPTISSPAKRVPRCPSSRNRPSPPWRN